MPTLNWVYGARTPDVEQAVSDAIFTAHRYRNKLCELELAKRERHEKLLQRLAPEYVKASAAVEVVETRLGVAREAIQEEKKKQRTKKPTGCEEFVASAKQCRIELKVLREVRKATKKAAYTDPTTAKAMAENTEQHKAAQAAAKAESGLYWGTEATTKTACGSFSSKAPPRFKRYEGEGQLGVQLQNGLDTRIATDRNTRLQLIIPPELEEAMAVDGKARGSLCRTAECLFRIGSDKGKPVFARLPISFHRPLPPGKIKWAFLERRRIADRVRWSIRLTIAVDREPEPAITKPSVAVHVGWRMDGDKLRVLTWQGGDGSKGTLSLPKWHLDDYLRLDEVQSIRDRKFNAIVIYLRQWLSGHETPDWLKEATKSLHQWHAPARLAALIWRWKSDRFDGDADILDEINTWRKSDKKRWQHERRLAVRVARRRKDWYRNFACNLKERFDVVIIAPISAKKLVERHKPEDLERDPKARRAKQAAVAGLLEIVNEKFGLRCVGTDAAGITRTCSQCGYDNAAPRRRVQCGGCLRTYDRDENAAVNTLARGEEALVDGALLANQRAEEKKEEEAKEKLLKMQEGARAARKRKLEAVQ